MMHTFGAIGIFALIAFAFGINAARAIAGLVLLTGVAAVLAFCLSIAWRYYHIPATASNHVTYESVDYDPFVRCGDRPCVNDVPQEPRCGFACAGN